MAHNFGPAYRDEAIVFGASRPGYPAKDVLPAEMQAWIEFMKGEGIARVVCLLPSSQLSHYREDLLALYQHAFLKDNVLHAPVDDFHLCETENLKTILAFLSESETLNQKVVVHCSGGVGRTGHVLAGWLIHARNFEVEEAINAIRNARPARNPLEAVGISGITRTDVVNLLRSCAPIQRG